MVIRLRRTVITHHTGRAGNAIRQRSGRPPPTFVTTSTTRRTLPQAGCSTRCEVGFLTRRFGLGASTDDVASGPPLTPRLACFALKLRVNSSFVTSQPPLARKKGVPYLTTNFWQYSSTGAANPSGGFGVGCQNCTSVHTIHTRYPEEAISP